MQVWVFTDSATSLVQEKILIYETQLMTHMFLYQSFVIALEKGGSIHASW